MTVLRHRPAIVSVVCYVCLIAVTAIDHVTGIAITAVKQKGSALSESNIPGVYAAMDSVPASEVYQDDVEVQYEREPQSDDVTSDNSHVSKYRRASLYRRNQGGRDRAFSVDLVKRDLVDEEEEEDEEKEKRRSFSSNLGKRARSFSNNLGKRARAFSSNLGKRGGRTFSSALGKRGRSFSSNLGKRSSDQGKGGRVISSNLG